MDIRNYFKRPKLSGVASLSTDLEYSSTSSTTDQQSTSSAPLNTDINTKHQLILSSPVEEKDVGLFIKHHLTDSLRHELLENCFKPAQNYDFKNDISNVSASARCFRLDWLDIYSPWLAYSPKLQGALCKYCVLFPQPVHRGLQGAFITKAFNKYKDFNDAARNHQKSSWHQQSTQDAANFMKTRSRPELGVDSQINQAVKSQIMANREKLQPILASIVFCATHDMALRGKTADTGNFVDLLKFRVESGDTKLQDHLTHARGNAKYTSVQVQNDLINVCGDILKKDIISAANFASAGFSILADETADIAGKEQLSVAVRFVDETAKPIMVKEEFIGFTELQGMDANNIAETILFYCRNSGLNLNKLIGQGYDGCSAMAGKEGGVQAKIKAIYPKALFVHCAAHRLNLIINDLNALSEIRNCIGTVKNIIKFFRESPQRRSILTVKIPLLCETRWSAKYSSIRIFHKNIEQIVAALSHLSTVSSNGNTRQSAYQMLSAVTTSTFLVCLAIIAKYAAILEPVCTSLQATQLDLLKVKNHVDNLLAIFESHRDNADKQFHDIFSQILLLADQLNTSIDKPRCSAKQTMRCNTPSSTTEDYFRVAMFIPYIDSILSSLQHRFPEENKPYYALFSVHPNKMTTMPAEEFRQSMEMISELYQFDNICEESNIWFEMWAGRKECNTTDITLTDLIEETTFFPAIRQILLTALTLPASTCVAERSFSTLRRVKTWLRSTMGGERLSGLCLMSVHRERIKSHEHFINSVIDNYATDKRRLQFIF